MSLRPDTKKIILDLIEERIKANEKNIEWISEEKAWKIKDQPGPHPKNWVEINNRKYPQKFVFSILLNLDVMDFHQNNAEDFFSKIGLNTGKC